MNVILGAIIVGGAGYLIWKLTRPQVQERIVDDPTKRPEPAPAVPARNYCRELATTGGAVFGASHGVPPQAGFQISALASKPICAMAKTFVKVAGKLPGAKGAAKEVNKTYKAFSHGDIGAGVKHTGALAVKTAAVATGATTVVWGAKKAGKATKKAAKKVLKKVKFW